MRYLSIVLLGSLASCSSQNAAPVASAASVQAATDTRSQGPSFAPGPDAEAAAPADAPSAATATATGSPAVNQEAAETNPRTPADKRADAPTLPALTGNAAALPAPSPPSSPYAADHTRVNARDPNGNTLTPTDQVPSESDSKITRQIRRAVGTDRSLSFTAKNVRIITINGKVTLRGAVKTDHERMKVAAAARKVAGDAQVDNFLELSN